MFWSMHAMLFVVMVSDIIHHCSLVSILLYACVRKVLCLICRLSSELFWFDLYNILVLIHACNIVFCCGFPHSSLLFWVFTLWLCQEHSFWFDLLSDHIFDPQHCDLLWFDLFSLSLHFWLIDDSFIFQIKININVFFILPIFLF